MIYSNILDMKLQLLRTISERTGHS
jgi:hypothetical protein